MSGLVEVARFSNSLDAGVARSRLEADGLHCVLFDSGFSAGLMRKDVRLALELATECEIDLPLSAEVKRIWQATQSIIPDTADFTRMADYRTQKEAR